MPNYIETIKKHIALSKNQNDKRIMNIALNLLLDSPIFSKEEIDILNDIFTYLKLDYTLNIIQDYETLNFGIELSLQDAPIIENKHDVMNLYHELSTNNSKHVSIEDCVLTFLDACEHIEENEILVINKIIDFMEKNWTLSPIVEKENKKYTIILPDNEKIYQKANL